MELRNLPLHLIDANPNQPRGTLRAIDELAASIAAVGLLQPLLVVEDGKRFRLVSGHRRLEALKKLGHEEVPALTAFHDTDVQELSRLMADNTMRDDMTTAEIAKGVQLLMDLGLKDLAVSKALGVKKADVKGYRELAKAPLENIPVQASLEEAAGLVEFAGNKRALELLTSRVGTGDFAHQLAQQRQERERTEKEAATLKALEAEGVAILPPNAETWRYQQLTKYELDITPEAHKDCPGHAATTDYNGEAIYYCTKPKLHGKPGSGAGPLSDAEKAARKAKKEGKALWTAATEVRRAHLHQLCMAKTPHASLLGWASHFAWEHGLTKGVEKQYTTSWEKHLSELARGLVGSSPKPEQSIFAQAAASVEYAIANWVDVSGGVNVVGNSDLVAKAAPYYALLAQTGYPLAECEGVLAGKVDVTVPTDSGAIVESEAPPTPVLYGEPVQPGGCVETIITPRPLLLTLIPDAAKLQESAALARTNGRSAIGSGGIGYTLTADKSGALTVAINNPDALPSREDPARYVAEAETRIREAEAAACEA